MRSSVDKILFSQHVYSGLRVACGVLGLSLLVFAATRNLELAAALTSGAVCVSVVDVPSPTRHKVIEFLITIVLCTLVVLGVALTRQSVLALGGCVLAVSFFTAMINAYGKKAMPISFSAIFAMIIAMGGPQHGELGIASMSGLFFLGGSVYAVYAVLVSWWQSYRTRQQVLAEICFELAQYIRIKAGFYESDAVLADCYASLVKQQAVIVDKQQSARDYLFYNLKNEADAGLAQTFVDLLDIFEHILASHADYELLHRYRDGADLLLLQRDLIGKAALHLDQIAYTSLRKQPPPHPVNYKAELLAIRYELDRLHRQNQDSDSLAAHALAAFENAFEWLQVCIKRIETLSLTFQLPVNPQEVGGGISLVPFIDTASYSPRLFFSHLSLHSPFFRYAIRMTLAMGCGFVLAHYLPYTTHSYWILLTIATVMRSSFSMTRQRRTDRILGNITGCILTALLLHFVPHPVPLLVALFAALAIAHSFVVIKYRYTAVASCVMALLQIHFLNMANDFSVGERIVDTLVGALLAYGFSYILPTWEYRTIPQQMAGLLEANIRYVETILRGASEIDYRLARKRIYDMIAGLSGAFTRMLQEPKGRHRNIAATQVFITENYLFATYAASLRIMMVRNAGKIMLSLAAPLLEQTVEQVRTTLERARSTLTAVRIAEPAQREAALEPPMVAGRAGQTIGEDDDSALLVDRLRDLVSCAQRIGVLADEQLEKTSAAKKTV